MYVCVTPCCDGRGCVWLACARAQADMWLPTNSDDTLLHAASSCCRSCCLPIHVRCQLAAPHPSLAAVPPQPPTRNPPPATPHPHPQPQPHPGSTISRRSSRASPSPRKTQSTTSSRAAAWPPWPRATPAPAALTAAASTTPATSGRRPSRRRCRSRLGSGRRTGRARARRGVAATPPCTCAMAPSSPLQQRGRGGPRRPSRSCRRGRPLLRHHARPPAHATTVAGGTSVEGATTATVGGITTASARGAAAGGGWAEAEAGGGMQACAHAACRPTGTSEGGQGFA